MEVDFLILGQGLAGTLLSRNLMQAGNSVMVIDNNLPNCASKTCGGIINPITGMRLVRTWLIEELLPYALKTFIEIGKELKLQPVRQCSILDFHPNVAAKEVFEKKAVTESQYLYSIEHTVAWEPYFRFNYGIGGIADSLQIDIASIIMEWGRRREAEGRLMKELFDWDELRLTDEGVVYKGINARKLICCEGAMADENPYFNRLPWSKDKGEALIAEIPDLPDTYIYKQAIGIVPLCKGLFWIGATHDWKYTDMKPTEAFRKKVEADLGYWLKVPYKIVDHLVGRRPANLDRRPFVGLHPVHQQVGILNGMGGKGCSFAPYFAHQFSAYLVEGKTIMPEVDVNRFSKVLSR